MGGAGRSFCQEPVAGCCACVCKRRAGWGAADNGPHSLVSWPWPLELGRQLLAKAAASAGPSRSPRPACRVALITWYVMCQRPHAHTRQWGAGGGGLTRKGPVGSEAACSSPTPKEGPGLAPVPSGSIPSPERPWPHFCIPSLSYSSLPGLRGLQRERRRRLASLYSYSQSPAHRHQCTSVE